MRLDQFLTEKHMFESRNKAAAAIREGKVLVNKRIVCKTSFTVKETDDVLYKESEPVYVARSAKKMLRAFDVFDLNWKDYIIADLGASTGGFCQVLLEKGAKKIYAIDVGTAQLHSLIAKDQRVINMEKTNAKTVCAALFPDPIQAITADLSFISITQVLPQIYQTLIKNGEAILLVKPQFEAGKEHLNKSGVVTDLNVHQKVLKKIIDQSFREGFSVKGISFSGLPGECGNREYLLYLIKGYAPFSITDSMIRESVYYNERGGII